VNTESAPISSAVLTLEQFMLEVKRPSGAPSRLD
jgi:hypothetical protein